MIDIGRSNWKLFQRSNEVYLDYAERLLRLNLPLVIFVENKFVDFVNNRRKGKERITRVVETSLKDFEYHAMYNQVKQAQQDLQEKRWKNDNFRNHPEMSCPEYVILMASKISALMKTIRINPFCSDYFYWLDFGCCRDDQMLPKSDCWAPHNLMNDLKLQNKVIFMANDPMPQPLLYGMKSLDEVILNMRIVYIRGLFFGGPAEPLFKFSELFHRTFVKLLARNFTDDDQTIMAACYLEQTENIMHLFPSDVRDIFNVFHIFY